MVCTEFIEVPFDSPFAMLMVRSGYFSSLFNSQSITRRALVRFVFTLSELLQKASRSVPRGGLEPPRLAAYAPQA